MGNSDSMPRLVVDYQNGIIILEFVKYKSLCTNLIDILIIK